ncbi:MAG: hypothetical protein ACP5T2_05225 [Thermoprotei archaeon]
MGRTQPSLTWALDEELNKMQRVANKLRNQELKENLEAIRPIVREIEEAMEDELSDPLEIILITLLVSCELPLSRSRTSCLDDRRPHAYCAGLIAPRRSGRSPTFILISLFSDELPPVDGRTACVAAV